MTNSDLAENKELNEFLTRNDESLKKMISTWRQDFIQFGGFNHLMKIFLEFQKKEYNEFTIQDKKILKFILEMLTLYLTISFSTKIEGVYRFLQLGKRIYLDLNFVESYLDLAISNPKELEIEKERAKSNIHVEIEEESKWIT